MFHRKRMYFEFRFSCFNFCFVAGFVLQAIGCVFGVYFFSFIHKDRQRTRCESSALVIIINQKTTNDDDADEVEEEDGAGDVKNSTQPNPC